MEPRIILQNVPEHLCFTCRFNKKCRRFKEIHHSLQAVEEDALEKWKVDVDVSYMITECDQYSVNWDLVNAIGDSMDFGTDDDEEGEGVSD